MNKETATQISYFLLRVVAGLLLLQAGGSKLFGWLDVMPEGQTLDTQMTIGGWIEIIGGFLVMVGLFTRPAAFILSGTMAVAYWQFHFKPELFWPAQNGGVPAAVLCFVFLFIAAYGAGLWSLDAFIWGRRKLEPEGSA